MRHSKIAGHSLPARLIALISAGVLCIALCISLYPPARALAASVLPLYYTFAKPGILSESPSPSQSSSPYFWLKSGGQLVLTQGVGESIQGAVAASNPLHTTYAKTASAVSDSGAHPQNMFELFSKAPLLNTSVQVYVDRQRDNFGSMSNRHAYNGESLIARYKDANNYYYAGVRADGYAVVKKKLNGVFTTLATKRLFSGTYNASTKPDLIPLNKWIGLKLVVQNNASGVPTLTLYTDIGWSGSWQQQLTVQDKGQVLSGPGTVGIESDFADIKIDSFSYKDAGAAPAPLATQNTTLAAVPSYDSVVLASKPNLYLAMNAGSTGKEIDKSGHGLSGSYKGGTPTVAKLPNGDSAADFNGTSQYLTVPSNAALSITTTHKFTWEAWIRPDTFSFPKAESDGYVDWMGKCQDYSPSCEWEARIYGATTAQGRPERLSAYVFSPAAGLGSGADWQPAAGVVSAGKWLHVVAEYDTTVTPSGCSTSHPGSINIWVNGVKQDFAEHAPTGCISQFSVTPKAGTSPLNIGTMAMDTFFKGAVGKVAIYDRLLSQSEISSHFKAMTGANPSGSCALTCSVPLLSVLGL